MARTGRPSIVDDTPDLQQRRKKFLAELRRGVSLNTAAAVARLGRSSVKRALQKGRASRSGSYHRFVQDVYEAMESARAGLERTLYTGAKKNPRLALSILRARYPHEWNPEVMVRVMRIPDEGDPARGKAPPPVRVVRETAALAALPAPAPAPPAAGET